MNNNVDPDTMQIRPEELRAKNFHNQEGRIERRAHFGEGLVNFYVPRMWEDIHRLADIDHCRQEIVAFNQAHQYRKRGMFLLPTKFGINFTAKFMNQGGALLGARLYHHR